MTMARRSVIPIYINNFNWLTPTRALAGYFDDVPAAEVIIVDNASTYPPLLEWYRSACPYKVVRLSANGGKHAPWNSGTVLPAAVHRALFGSDYYVVTDPDLSLDACPKDLLEFLTAGLQRYPSSNKVGLSLEIDDLPSECPWAVEAERWERQFWTQRRDEQFFQAGVDTTFALYSVDTPHGTAKRSDPNALRSDRPYTARHLPWYMKTDELTQEELYYFSSVRNGVWGKKWKERLDRDRVPLNFTASIPAYSNCFWQVTAAETQRYHPQWRISGSLQNSLVELLSVCRPQSILEFGAGLSSILFFRYCVANPDVEYRAIDEAGPPADRFLAHMSELGFDTKRVAVCRLVDGYYELPDWAFDRDQGFDLVLVDGPAGSHRRGGRRAIDVLLRHVTNQSLIVIDDTHRSSEKSLVARIVEHFGQQTFESISIPDVDFPPRCSTVLVPHRYQARLGESSFFQGILRNRIRTETGNGLTTFPDTAT